MVSMKRSRRVAFGGFLLLLIACSDNGVTPPVVVTPTPPAELAAPARAYLEEVISLMQTNSVRRQSIDWTAFRSSVFAAAGSAQTVSQTYPAITKALTLLGDGHTSYQGVDGTFLFVQTRFCGGSLTVAPTNLPANIGYVRVSEFSGNASHALAFARDIQNQIHLADRSDLIGWIVDLRGNRGGNMWPMIAGVGPLLGDGIAGWFIDPVGFEIPWGYHDGASWIGNNQAQPVDVTYTLIKPNPRVAVLVDNLVASSGEATFLAFVNRPNTRSFGTSTCGLSTPNLGYTMSDGALLNLAVSTMADRTKTKYGGQIDPDESVTGRVSPVDVAVAWLQAANQ